jgi:hypothetical protein
LADWELGDAVALVYPGNEPEEETSDGKDDESLAGNVRAELRQRSTPVRQGSADNQLFWSVLPHAARHSRV